jgi:hypothetical protein
LSKVIGGGIGTAIGVVGAAVGVIVAGAGATVIVGGSQRDYIRLVGCPVGQGC